MKYGFQALLLTALLLTACVTPSSVGRPAATGTAPSSQAAAHCPRSSVPVPALQQHIEVLGAWVLDMQHGGHAELHPVWSWKYIP